MGGDCVFSSNKIHLTVKYSVMILIESNIEK